MLLAPLMWTYFIGPIGVNLTYVIGPINVNLTYFFLENC